MLKKRGGIYLYVVADAVQSFFWLKRAEKCYKAWAVFQQLCLLPYDPFFVARTTRVQPLDQKNVYEESTAGRIHYSKAPPT